jgi:hypothetical protein
VRKIVDKMQGKIEESDIILEDLHTQSTENPSIVTELI